VVTCEKVDQSCIIFGLAESYPTVIQLQTCPNCHPNQRCFIGPDGRRLGIFNFNNRVLFTHELLNEYTSMYTSSETPFTAWVSTVSRRYKIRNSPNNFVNEQMFRDVWFSYVKLQWFENDMQCPVCGPTPNDTIWDGVTLSFSRKHLLPSLQPPTVSHVDSITRRSRYQREQQILTQPTTRKALQKVITGRSLVIRDDELKKPADPTLGSDEVAQDTVTEGEDISGRTILGSSAADDLLDHIKAIPVACKGLRKTNLDLAAMFMEHYGPSSILERHEVPEAYRRFFVQVSVFFESVRPVFLQPAMGLDRGRGVGPSDGNTAGTE
jgi:hypothetical protein